MICNINQFNNINILFPSLNPSGRQVMYFICSVWISKLKGQTFSALHALHYQESVSQVAVINLKSDGKGHWENTVHKAKKSQLGMNLNSRMCCSAKRQFESSSLETPQCSLSSWKNEPVEDKHCRYPWLYLYTWNINVI